MTAIIGLLLQNGLTASAHGDCALYADTSTRAFQNELGVQDSADVWYLLGFFSDGDAEAFGAEGRWRPSAAVMAMRRAPRFNLPARIIFWLMRAPAGAVMIWATAIRPSATLVGCTFFWCRAVLRSRRRG